MRVKIQLQIVTDDGKPDAAKGYPFPSRVPRNRPDPRQGEFRGKRSAARGTAQLYSRPLRAVAEDRFAHEAGIRSRPSNWPIDTNHKTGQILW